MSRTSRRKNKIFSTGQWDSNHYYKKKVYYGDCRWSYWWVPIDKQKEPELWKVARWQAHKECDHRYDHGPDKGYRKRKHKSLRNISRKELHRFKINPDYEVIIRPDGSGHWFDDGW